MSQNKKNRWAGLLIGPAMALFALTGLWKNEARFDFHKAARDAQTVDDVAGARDGETISFTGPMDQELSISGEYVESFTGFLSVDRDAEIYAWDRDEDSEHRVSWSLRWMNGVESNSRNSGVHQQLSSTEFKPSEYRVSQFVISTDKIEFVDSKEQIPAGQLNTKRLDLRPEGDKFYLRKNRGQNLGDERVSYSGIPIPATATYFGRFQSGQGVADTTHERTGWISAMIMDTGILHHIVAGDRETALATMRRYLGRLKWIVRGIGIVVTVLGIYIFFATIVGVLFHIPVIGSVAKMGTWLLALVIGIPLAVTTILLSYIVSHPLVLIGILVVVAALYVWMSRRGATERTKYQAGLASRFGEQVEKLSLKDMEFLELARFAMSDAKFGAAEEAFLKKWARKHRWDDDKFQQMLDKARQSGGTNDSIANDDHLANLIHLAMADGEVTEFEMRSIRTVARNVGYDDKTISQLTQQVRASVLGS